MIDKALQICDLDSLSHLFAVIGLVIFLATGMKYLLQFRETTYTRLNRSAVFWNTNLKPEKNIYFPNNLVPG